MLAQSFDIGIREAISAEAWKWYAANESLVIGRIWFIRIRVRDARPIFEKLFGRQK